MPCYDPCDSYRQGEADGSVDTEQRLRAEFRHNSDVAQLLCEAMQLLKADYDACDSSSYSDISPELRQWWVEHQQRDAKR